MNGKKKKYRDSLGHFYILNEGTMETRVSIDEFKAATPVIKERIWTSEPHVEKSVEGVDVTVYLTSDKLKHRTDGPATAAPTRTVGVAEEYYLQGAKYKYKKLAADGSVEYFINAPSTIDDKQITEIQYMTLVPPDPSIELKPIDVVSLATPHTTIGRIEQTNRILQTLKRQREREDEALLFQTKRRVKELLPVESKNVTNGNLHRILYYLDKDNLSTAEKTVCVKEAINQGTF